MELRSIMLLFRDFLNVSQPNLESIFLHDKKGLYGDWLQANWEILVESQVGATITHYGEGADCNGASSRIWQPEIIPTHRIFCKDTNSGLSHAFFMFVWSDGEKYTTDPPFTHVMTDDWILIAIEDAEFSLREI